MKLRNKLIPLASVATLGAIVAPTVTSCACSDFVDLVDGYTPSIAKARQSDVSFDRLRFEDSVLEYYMNQVQNNPEILVQDAHWTMHNQIYKLIDISSSVGQFKLNKFEQKISNVQVKKIKYVYEEEEVPYYTYNWAISYDIETRYDINIETPTISLKSGNLSMDRKISIKNVPTEMYFADSTLNENSYLDLSSVTKWVIGINETALEYYKPVSSTDAFLFDLDYEGTTEASIGDETRTQQFTEKYVVDSIEKFNYINQMLLESDLYLLGDLTTSFVIWSFNLSEIVPELPHP